MNSFITLAGQSAHNDARASWFTVTSGGNIVSGARCDHRTVFWKTEQVIVVADACSADGHIFTMGVLFPRRPAAVEALNHRIVVAAGISTYKSANQFNLLYPTSENINLCN